MNSLIKLACVSVAGVSLFAGCAAERHAEIPQSAAMVAQGGEKLTYTAPHDGMAWVYNKFNGNMEWAGGVKSGDTLTVDPDHSKILVNGHDVNDKPMTHDEKRIFFQADAQVVSERTSPAIIQRTQTVDPVTGRVMDTTTETPSSTVREYRTVRP